MGDCFLMGHGGYSLPKLNPLQSINLTDYNQSATFTVSFAKHGRPKEYTYKWYISEDGSSWNTITENGEQSLVLSSMDYKKEQYWIKCKVINKKGEVETNEASLTLTPAQPLFTYMVNGVDKTDDINYVSKSGWGTSDWKLKFLQSGTLTFINRGSAQSGMDIFLVGGGAGGTNAYGEPIACGGAGGGGGRVKTVFNKSVLSDTQYQIDIGAGGEAGSAGKPSKFGSDISVDGGSVGSSSKGGDGGSGGGAGGQYWFNQGAYVYNPGDGGSDGENGGNSKKFNGGVQYGGQGLDSTTYEFQDSNSGILYAGGGAGGQGYEIYYKVFTDTADGGEGGGGDSGKPGAANTGGGGGGGNFGKKDSSGKPGGSGIIIIRNAR